MDRSYSRSISTTQRSAADWSVSGRTSARCARAIPSTSRPNRDGCSRASVAVTSPKPSRLTVRSRPSASAAAASAASVIGGGAAASPACRKSGPSTRSVENRAAREWISRRKSSAANRPSPSLPGSVFDVAARFTPCSASWPSSRVISIVSPGSSSSNSSTAISRRSVSRRTVSPNPSAPTRCVYSTKVPYALGPGTACQSEASRWVFPTPNPPSR